MGIKSINVELDSKTIRTGGVVSGHVKFEVTHHIFVDSVMVQFKGIAELKFSRNSGLFCRKREACFEHKLTLWDNHTKFFGQKPSPMPPGNHNCAFSFAVPSTIPGSVTGECGSISYFCVAVAKMHRSLRSIHSDKVKFNVIESQPNLLPRDDTLGSIASDGQSLNSFVSRAEKQTSCFGFNFGVLRVIVHLKSTVYHPKQCMSLNIEIENASKGFITEVAVGLVEKRSYRCGKVALTCRSVVVGTISLRQIPPGEKYDWVGIKLHIPETVNFDVGQSKNISVEHEVVVNLTPWSSSNVRIRVPIVITA